MSGDINIWGVITSWLHVLGAPVIMIVISIVYFIGDRTGSSFASRVLVSAHGLVAAIIDIVAIIIWNAGFSHRWWALPFQLIHFFPLGLIVLSINQYRGSKLIHILQLPNLAAMVWGFIIGGMAITNDWL